MGILSFIGAAYSLFLFSATQHGLVRDIGNMCFDGDCREHLIL
jgi:hypothetical protein